MHGVRDSEGFKDVKKKKQNIKTTKPLGSCECQAKGKCFANPISCIVSLSGCVWVCDASPARAWCEYSISGDCTHQLWGVRARCCFYMLYISPPRLCCLNHFKLLFISCFKSTRSSIPCFSLFCFFYGGLV